LPISVFERFQAAEIDVLRFKMATPQMQKARCLAAAGRSQPR